MHKFGLSEQEIIRFKRDGYIGPFDLYRPEEIKARYRKIRAALFDRKNAVYELPVQSVIAGYDRHLDIAELSEHVVRPEIVDRLNTILGPNVICWRSEMFPKYPGDEGTDWHQADTFAHASGQPQIVWPDSDYGGAITVWTAFTDATKKNGCLRFIPGTQEEMFYDESKEMYFDPDSVNSVEKGGQKMGFFGYDYRNLQKDSNFAPDESKSVAIEMRAGQFVIFWSTLMHASYPNSTENQTRMGFTSRYVPTSVKVYPDTETVTEYGSTVSLDEYGVVLVSGEDVFKHNRVRNVSMSGYEFRPINAGK